MRPGAGCLVAYTEIPCNASVAVGVIVHRRWVRRARWSHYAGSFSWCWLKGKGAKRQGLARLGRQLRRREATSIFAKYPAIEATVWDETSIRKLFDRHCWIRPGRY